MTTLNVGFENLLKVVVFSIKLKNCPVKKRLSHIICNQIKLILHLVLSIKLIRVY